MQQEIKKYLSQISVLTVGDIYVRILGIGVFALLTRLLGPEDYGFWLLLLSVVELTSTFVSLGVSNSINRYTPHLSQNEADQFFVSSILLPLLLSFVAVAVSYVSPNGIARLAGFPNNFGNLISKASWLITFVFLETIIDMYFKSRRRVKRAFFFMVTKASIELLLICVYYLDHKHKTHLI